MKNSEFVAVVIVVIIVAAGIGSIIYYGRQPPSTPQNTPAQSSVNQGGSNVLVESGEVSSVDSNGGQFSISNVTSDINPLWITLTASQLDFFQYGKDYEVTMTYGLLSRRFTQHLGK